MFIIQTVNAILTAVVAGMRKDEPDAGVRLAATTALGNALEFAATNFEAEAERNYLMQCVCEGAAAPDARVRAAAFECLVKIAAAHYDLLPAYMAELFALTVRAVREDSEEVAKQALELWCTVAEEEADRAEDAAGGVHGVVQHRFVSQALHPLAALLLDQLTKQEAGQDEDAGAWNLAMAAGTTLGLVAAAAGDPIVDLVMPFVQAGIGRADGGPEPEAWRHREAATFAFGSILEGPSPGRLADLVRSGLAVLVGALGDASPAVRHTTAWALGRVFEFVHGAPGAPPVIPPGALPTVVAALLQATRDAPHIAEKACYAISQLVAGFAAAAAGSGDESRLDLGGGAGDSSEPGAPSPSSSPVSPYMKDIMAALLDAGSRAAAGGTTSGAGGGAYGGADAARGATAAFEALNEVVRSAPADAAPLVAALIPVTLERLAAAVRAAPAAAAGGGGSSEQVAEVQGALCGVLTVVTQRLASSGEAGRAAVAPHADTIMAALLAVAGGGGAAALEDALLAAGALTYAAGPAFAAYLPNLMPVLEAALANTDDWAAAGVAVGVLGDVGRAVEGGLAPYAPPLVARLLGALQSTAVRRDLKPPILSALGDLALAVGDAFTPFLPHVLPMLASAQALATEAAARAGPGDEEASEYVDALRSGVLEAYAGLINGLSGPAAASDPAFAAAMPGLLAFVDAVGASARAAAAGGLDDAHAPPGPLVVRSAVSLLGDVAAGVPSAAPLFQAIPGLAPFVDFCRSGGGPPPPDPALAEQGGWALQAINAAVARAGGGA